MTAEGALYFVVMIGAVVALFGAGAEILTLFAKNPKIKYIPIVITGVLFLITGITNGFKEGSTILFGLMTAEEILVLLVYLLIKKLKKKK